MADWSSTLDSRDPPLLQYIERCSARLNNRQFASLHLSGDAKVIRDVHLAHSQYGCEGVDKSVLELGWTLCDRFPLSIP